MSMHYGCAKGVRVYRVESIRLCAAAPVTASSLLPPSFVRLFYLHLSSFLFTLGRFLPSYSFRFARRKRETKNGHSALPPLRFFFALPVLGFAYPPRRFLWFSWRGPPLHSHLLLPRFLALCDEEEIPFPGSLSSSVVCLHKFAYFIFK